MGQRFARNITWGTACLALASALAVWGMVGMCDYYWLSTLLAFGPRWVLLLPLAAVVPAAAVWRRLALAPLGLAGLIVAGPVMGFCLPWPGWIGSSTGGVQIKVLTCNMGGGGEESRLLALIHSERPDVVALQEWPSQRPWPESLAAGRHVTRHGQLVIASRHPIIATTFLKTPIDPWRTAGLRCDLETPEGPISLCCLHLMTPRRGLEAVLHARLAGLDELRDVTELRNLESRQVAAWLEASKHPRLIVGDLNMPQESQIYHRHFGGYTNAFAVAGLGYGFTKYTRWWGTRIDHVLTSAEVGVTTCRVGPSLGGDHRPTIVRINRGKQPISYVGTSE